MFTHEQFIQKVARIVTNRKGLSDDQRATLNAIKLCYGAGQSGLRGVTYYDRWGLGPDKRAPFVEVCAFGQESTVQLAGTTIHELGHVLAGWGAGHGKGWLDACQCLGLTGLKAAGTEYKWECFDPEIRGKIQKLGAPDDGAPVGSIFTQGGAGHTPTGRAVTLKPCGAGIGTRGGVSRGVGSGSRLRLYECECTPPVKVRVARDTFDATCNCCTRPFRAPL
jgi:hypothetical protein